VPTLKEQGYDVHAGGFRGFVAHGRRPRAKWFALWETTLSKVHKSAGWQDYMKSNMYEDLYMNAEEMTRWLVSEQADYARFLTEMGLVMKKEEKK
jgi:tripartite-type tricarboxylate transporter receptor subunit TctC